MLYREFKFSLSNDPKKKRLKIYFCLAGHVYMLAGDTQFKKNACELEFGDPCFKLNC